MNIYSQLFIKAMKRTSQKILVKCIAKKVIFPCLQVYTPVAPLTCLKCSSNNKEVYKEVFLLIK